MHWSSPRGPHSFTPEVLWGCPGRGVGWDMAPVPAAFSCFPLSYHGNGHGWDRKSTGTGGRHDTQRAFLKEAMGEL